jgi:uncharacterized protein YdhG (YjbR/CyaY superfamily)
MADKEWRPGNVLDIFGDSIARATLVIANDRPVAVKELAEELDVSNPTIYRRIGPLVDANLLKEHHRAGPNDTQHKEYETMLNEAVFSVEDDGYTVDIRVRQDITDDFDSIWSDLERVGHAVDSS